MTAQADAFRRSLLLQTSTGYNLDPTGGATRILPEIAFAIPFKTIADTLIRIAPIRFLQQLQEAVHSTNTPPLTPQEQALSDDFDALFGHGGAGLGPAEKIVFGQATRSAHHEILDNYLNNLGPNNWIHFTDIGAWGGQVLDRASITEFIQYGNGISTAAYYHTFRDGDGAALTGNAANGYVLTFPPDGQPQRKRFWSLTAYKPDAIELIPNTAGKYVVASDTHGLQTNPKDGSLSIYISKTKPAGVPKANWLPVGNGNFNVMLRVYGVVPGSAVADNTYVPPPVDKRSSGR